MLGISIRKETTLADSGFPQNKLGPLYPKDPTYIRFLNWGYKVKIKIFTPF
jgi:hypothetical protein